MSTAAAHTVVVLRSHRYNSSRKKLLSALRTGRPQILRD